VKKTRYFLFVVFFFTVIVFPSFVRSQDNWIENSFGSVHWNQPPSWLESPFIDDYTYGIYIGKLDENEDLDEGCGFFVMIQENLEEEFIKGMLNDKNTIIDFQGNILLDGFPGVQYKGVIQLDDPIEFNIMFFKKPIVDGKQIVIGGFIRGKLGETKRSELEKIIQSVKLNPEEVDNETSKLSHMETSSEVLEISSNALCKNVVNGEPKSISDVFTFNDSRIYLWISLKPFKERHTLLWKWYSPDGELFGEVPYNLPSAKEMNEDILEDYRAWSYLNVNTIDKSQQGSWFVKLYCDNKLVLTRLFRLMATEVNRNEVEIASNALCKDVKDGEPIDQTTEFTFNDERIYLWLTLTPFKDKQKVTWRWYSPDNKLYFKTDLTTPSSKDQNLEVMEDYSCWAWLYIDKIEKDLVGTWIVEVYINDIKRLTKKFRLSDENASSDFKEIQIDDVFLRIPKNTDYFKDDENPESYYIILNSDENAFSFVGVEFSDENLIDEADFTYEGPWFTASVVESTTYDKERNIRNKFWYAKVDSYVDSKGRYIYLFFFSPEDYFEEYKSTFKKIFDSLKLIVY